MGEEVWFEKRYPNILEGARLRFIGIINSWVQSHWGVSQFKERGQRINLFSRGGRRNDNRFEQCGDKPQDAWEADKVLGSFSLDIETPITIDYSENGMSGKNIDSFAWTTNMYVEDVLGLQEHDPIYNWATAKLFPSRRVTRAKWKIQGKGLSYLVKAGDSLSKIALALYGDQRKWKQIHEANRSQVTNPDVIVPGQRLTIPVVVAKD